jgi:hypothetical protein
MLKPVGPKISQKSFDFYGANFATVNAGTAYTLESFPALYRHTLLRELRGKFERQELLLMLDVCNGLVLTPGMAGQHLLADVSDGIALDGLAEKWEIDGPALLAKLQALSIFQAHCLEVWCRAFWEQSGEPESVEIEKWVEQLL